jgi:alkylhydroperoxidase family enzyme
MSDEPRIPALPPEEWHHELDPVLELRLGGGEPLGQHNIFRTLANHPRLMRAWLPFGGMLLARGRIPPVDRELLILRTAWNTRSPYEWGQHVRIGLEAGVTREQIDAIPSGPGGAVWTDHERLLLAAADELHADNRISDDTWQGFVGIYDTEQLIELPMLIGQYHMVAFLLNSLRVEPDEGLEPLPEG